MEYQEKDGVLFIEEEDGYFAEYKDASTHIPSSISSIEHAMESEYVIILSEWADRRHYRVVSSKDGKICYPYGKTFSMGLKQALDWVSHFKTDEEMAPYRKEFNLLGIYVLDDIQMDWILSYMPKKRSSIPKALREEVYAKCDGRCAYCGKPIDITEMQVDHVDSHYRHRGKDSIDNYLPACRDCNGLKSDYLLEEFRDTIIPKSIKKAKICGFNANKRNARIALAYKNSFKNGRIEFYFERMKDK